MRTLLTLVSLAIVAYWSAPTSGAVTKLDARYLETINLREGRMDHNISYSNQESSYAGYTFDIKIAANNSATIIFGRPRQGLNGSTISSGALFTCNFTLNISDSSTHDIVSKSSCKRITIVDRSDSFHPEDGFRTNADAFGLILARTGDGHTYGTCAPLRERVCPSNLTYVPGACYIGTLNDNNWRYQYWLDPGCYLSDIEIIFLVDGSASITPKNFDIVKDWLVNVIQRLAYVFGASLKSSIIQFSKDPRRGDRWGDCDYANFVIPYRLQERLSLAAMTKKIRNMDYLNGMNTFTFQSLFKIPECYPATGDSRRFLVVLTDGRAEDGAYADSWYNQHAVSNKITPFAVAVGDASTYMQQLTKIVHGRAEPSERVMTIKDFNTLSSVIDRLVTSIRTSVSLESSGSAQTGSTTNDGRSDHVGISAYFTEKGNLYTGGIGTALISGVELIFVSDDDTSSSNSNQRKRSGLAEAGINSYVGYTITIGKFDESVHLLAGAPRYQFFGAVINYDINDGRDDPVLQLSKTIQSPKQYQQAGMYFGSNLLAMDFNNDSRDDLLVAAPLYNDKRYEEGLVFVYASQVNQSFSFWVNLTTPTVLYGDRAIGGQFGTGMANAGDLNNDGFKDIIIGAPLADNGRGTVYVYLGGSGRLRNEPHQIIKASTLPGPRLQYFGKSIQGDVDIDGNGFPDIIVGSPKSEHLTFLRSIEGFSPITSISSNTRTNISLHDCVENKLKNCFIWEYCLQVNKTWKSKQDSVVVNCTLILDTKKGDDDKRMQFSISKYVLHNESEISLDKKHCYNITPDMTSNLLAKDSISPVGINVTCRVVEIIPNGPFLPYLDRSIPATLTYEAKFVNTTQPDLYAPVSINNVIELGNSSDLVFTVNWTNRGQASYETYLKVSASVITSAMRIFKVSSNSDYSLNKPCAKRTISENFDTDGHTSYFRYDSDFGKMADNSWCVIGFILPLDDLLLNGTVANVTVTTSTDSNSSFSNNLSRNKTWTNTTQLCYIRKWKVTAKRSDVVTVNDYYPSTNGSGWIVHIKKARENASNPFKVENTGKTIIKKLRMEYEVPSIDGSAIWCLRNVICTSDDPQALCTCKWPTENQCINITYMEDDAIPRSQTLERQCRPLFTNRMQRRSSGISKYNISCSAENLKPGKSVSVSVDLLPFKEGIKYNYEETIAFYTTNESPLECNGNLQTKKPSTTKTTATESITRPVIRRAQGQGFRLIDPGAFFYIYNSGSGLSLILAILFGLNRCGCFTNKYQEKMKVTEDSQTEDSQNNANSEFDDTEERED